MPTRKQKGRIASLTTPLGEDVLVATGFAGEEGLSRLFEFRVTAESDQDAVDLKSVMGHNCAVTIHAYGKERCFNGLLVEAQWRGAGKNDESYSLVLRPWLWLLTQTANCRIFVDSTVPDIIKSVFQGHGLTDYKFSLQADYTKLEYCVQYGESDFAFVSRLMEQNGIYYYFTHSADAHTLVLVDASSGHKKVEGDGKVGYHPGREGSLIGKEHFHEFTSERRLRTGKITINDYDFLQSSADLKAEDSGGEGYLHGDLEMFNYPGKYPRSGPLVTKKQDDGTTLAKIRLGASQALDRRRYAQGDAASLFPGGVFTLERHLEDGDYVVIAAQHRLAAEAYRSGGGSEGPEIYDGSYELQPNDRVFRAPLVTPRPLVHGPQTAKVVGKDGEEIDVDQYGRVLVQFFWDREQRPSRRVRVAQVWSGAKWGGQVIPRIGQEVVVEFLEGDPDRPLVVGTVYNDKMQLPYELPANQTMSGLKSNSSKGGSGYNEFVFEDKKGSETIRMHAQKDHEVVILDSESRTIGASFEKQAKGDPSRSTTLKKGDDKLTVEQGDHVTTVSVGDQTVDVTAGNQTVKVGQCISITAGLKIELTVGPSKITLDPSGVTIKAPMIQLQADGVLKAQAPVVQVNADGVLMLKGAVTMIN